MPAQRAQVLEVLRLTKTALGRFRTIAPWDQEDLAQDALLRALQKLEGEEMLSLTRFVSAVAGNQGRDFLRWRRRQIVEVTDSGVLDPEAERSTHEDRLGARQSLRRVFALLSPEQESAVVLHLAEGLTFEQIAEREGITRSLAENRVRTAAAKMRRALNQERESAAGVGAAFVLWLFMRASAEVPEAPASDPPPSGTRRKRPLDVAPRTRVLDGCKRSARVLFAMLVAGLVVSQHKPPEGTPFAAFPDSAASHAARTVAPASIAQPRGPRDVAPAIVLPPAMPRPRQQRRTNGGEGEARLDDALIQRARAALADRDLGTALDLCDQHERRFPHNLSAGARARIRREACAFGQQASEGGMPAFDHRALERCAEWAPP